MRKEFGGKKFITMTHKSRLQTSPGTLRVGKIVLPEKGGKMCLDTREEMAERKWGWHIQGKPGILHWNLLLWQLRPPLYKLTFFFCWNIIDLQYCISFRGIAKWLNYTDVCIYLYSFSLLFHDYLLWDIEYGSLCYTVNPVDHFIYGSVHLLIQYSQFILPPAPQINFLIEVEHK